MCSLKAQRQDWQQVSVSTILPMLGFSLGSAGRIRILGRLADQVHHHSRQAIKKYVKANNEGLATASDAQFDVMFNKAVKSGVEKGDFTQPKGTSRVSSQWKDACNSFSASFHHSNLSR